MQTLSLALPLPMSPKSAPRSLHHELRVPYLVHSDGPSPVCSCIKKILEKVWVLCPPRLPSRFRWLSLWTWLDWLNWSWWLPNLLLVGLLPCLGSVSKQPQAFGMGIDHHSRLPIPSQLARTVTWRGFHCGRILVLSRRYHKKIRKWLHAILSSSPPPIGLSIVKIANPSSWWCWLLIRSPNFNEV